MKKIEKIELRRITFADDADDNVLDFNELAEKLNEIIKVVNAMTHPYPVLTDEAFERTKLCREGHNCCHNNNFGGELCEDCRIDPETDYR